ncbi:MAG: phosphoglucosamine mutase [Pirellulaceae bacterium]
MSNAPLIISVSGLRGVVGKTLTPLVALEFARAYATQIPDGPILVARDGRTTGPMIADAVRSGLAAMGRTVCDVGVAATPTVGVLVKTRGAAGAVQISASHNPPEYNGIKLFGGDGRVLTAVVGAKVAKAYQTGNIAWADYGQVSTAETISDTITAHLEAVLGTVDVERIQKCRFSVLLDSNHGAGAVLGRPLLERLGCKVVILGEDPTGRFSHPAEPTADNLRSVLRNVREANAAIGFCQDPDADRLAVVDENGRYVGEEYTLALCLDHRLRQQVGLVVANCASSRMSQDITEKHGGTFLRSKVGEANVADLMISESAVYGGEGNGGPIDPKVGYVRDSFVGMAQILDAMAARGLSVSALADELPVYAIHKTKTTVASERTAAALQGVKAHYPEATASESDGLRLDWPGRWLLVRASNTEPIVRVIAEAGDIGEAKSMCEDATKVISACT